MGVLSEVVCKTKPGAYSAQSSCTVKDCVGTKLFRCIISVRCEVLTQHVETEQETRLRYARTASHFRAVQRCRMAVTKRKFLMPARLAR